MSENKNTVLVVDNEKDLADSISTALEHEGFSVLVENGGKPGLATTLREHPDMILLDIEMPDMTGIEVLKELRKDDWGRNVTVVIMTVVDDFQKIAEVVENKGDAYILKNDLDLFTLVELVREKIGS